MNGWRQIGRDQSSVAVHMIGKLKTSVQMVAIPLPALPAAAAGIDTRAWGQVLIWIAAVLTVWSMVYYLKGAAEIRARVR